MNFMKFDFVFKFFLFQHKQMYTLKLTIALNFSLLCHIICFQSFFPSFFKVDLHLTNVSRMTDAICWQMFFFQSPLGTKEMFCLSNKFVLLTNHKQLLKCVQQNSYLDLWSNTLHIIWQRVHLTYYLTKSSSFSKVTGCRN